MARIRVPRPSDHIPDSAMADVAFLLLIFFLATTTIAEEFGLSVVLPAKSSQTPRVQVNRENVLTLSTDAAGGQVYADGVPVTLDDVRQLVRDRQAANDRLVVRLEPARKTPYRVMVDLLDEVKLGGARRISIKTGS